MTNEQIMAGIARDMARSLREKAESYGRYTVGLYERLAAEADACDAHAAEWDELHEIGNEPN